MTNVKLGISPLSWTNQAIMELGDHISYETCITEAAEAGYIGVELGRKFPKKPADIFSSLAKLDLSAVSAWYSGYLSERSLKEEWVEAAPYADFLIELGCPVMVYGECGAGPAAGAKAKLDQRSPLSDINFAEYTEKLTTLADRLQARGISLVYHSHMMQPIESNDEIDMLMENTGPSVKLILDTGHIAMSGGDYVEVMEKWWDRIGHIHLKDMRRKVFENLDRSRQTFDDAVYAGLFTVPGDGDIDFAPLIGKIASDGYDGWLLVEAEQDPEIAVPGPLAKSSFFYLEALLDNANIDFKRNVNRV